ncbi:MAG: Ig-like domain-containing protein [Verrucomicrobiota bacterium]
MKIQIAARGLGLLLSLTGLANVQGAEYYVSTVGSDSNPGTLALPVRTITRAYSMAGAGDTITVLPGVYTDYTTGWGLRMGKSGTATSPITLRSQVPRAAVIDGQNRSDRNQGIYLDGSYNIVDGFEIRGGPHGGIAMYGSYNQIRNNDIHHNGNPANTSTLGQDGIFSDQNTRNNVYAGNLIRDNGRTGSNLDHALYLCGDNELVINNVLIRNASWGLHLAGYSTVSNLRAYNNVMAFNGKGGVMLWMALNGVDIKNNIIYKNGQYGINSYDAHGSGVVVDRNLVFGNSFGNYNFSNGGSDYTYTLGTTVSAEPLFVDATSATFDAHLLAGSPAVNAGLNLSSVFTTDIDGVARPASGAWDLGPYQVVSLVNSAPTISIISGQIIAQGGSTGPLAFTVGDAETPASNLTVSGSSSNPTLVPGSGISFGGSGGNRTVTVTPAATQTGTATITVTVNDGSVSTSTSFVLTVNPPSSSLTFASTGGAISAPFAAGSGVVSQPLLTLAPADGGRAAYTFNITNAGAYVVTALVNAPDDSANSFFVNIDAEPVDPTMVWDIPLTSGLVERTVSWRGSGTPTNNEFAPKVFTLTTGTHQLIVRGREANTQLGTITLKPYTVSNPPPTIALTAPANGASYTAPAAIDLTASVNANGATINKVQFYQGATLLGEDTTAPYTYSWSNVAAGSYSLSARAVYGAGNDTVASSPVSVAVSNPPPTIALTAPASGASYTAPAMINLAASVNANGNTINKVQFYQGTTLLGEDTAAPYTFAWNNVGAGSYSLSARAVYNTSSTVASSSASVSVIFGLTFDSTSGVISAPFMAANGLIYQTNHTLIVADSGRAVYTFNIANAGDYVVTALVNAPDANANSFFVNIDAEPIDPTMIWDIPLTSGLEERAVSWRGSGTVENNEFAPKVFTLTAGTHQLIVRGREANAQLGTITLKPYANTPPVVTLTAPGNGSTVSGPAVTVAADASDDSGVAGVQFKLNGMNLGTEVTAAPYSVTWDTTTVTNGLHTLTAVARDSAGNQTTAVAVSVVVSNTMPTVLPTVTVTATDAIATIGTTDHAALTFTRTGDTSAALAVNYTLGGSAVKWIDYRRPEGDMPVSVTIPAGAASYTMTIIGVTNATAADPHTVVITLATDAAYDIGAASSATVTLIGASVPPPAPPTVNVTASDANASRVGPDNGSFTIIRTDGTTTALTVNFTLGGTAANGVDYASVPLSVTLPAGAASATVMVAPLPSNTVVGSKTAVLTLANDAAYTVGATGNASVTIAGNAVPITSLKFTGNSATITWASAAGKTYRVAYKTSLTDTNWTDASGNITATGPSSSWTDTAASRSQQRFYVVYMTN